MSPTLFERSEEPRHRTHVHEMILPADGSGAAAQARDLTRRVLQSRPNGRTTARPAGDVVLAVSELISNAFSHGEGPVTVRLRAIDSGLLAEVHDSANEPLRPRQPCLDGTGGYGLHIVNALADGWGSSPTADGKAVWAIFGWQA